MDAECNEATPAIAFPRIHEDSEMLSKTTSKSLWPSRNRQVREETRTDVESATFEQLETTVTFSVLIPKLIILQILRGRLTIAEMQALMADEGSIQSLRNSRVDAIEIARRQSR